MINRSILLVATIIYSQVLVAQCTLNTDVETLGIGLVSYDNFNHFPPTINLYNDPELKESFCSWKLYEDTIPPFCAKFHKPDYGIAEMVVLDTLTNVYKVLVNFDNIKYLPRDINYVFNSWNEYLLGSLGVRRKIQTARLRNQPILKTSSEFSEEVDFPEGKLESLCVVNVSDDWINVVYNCFYLKPDNVNEGIPCSEYIDECSEPVSGWLRWREGNKILIDIFTMI